MYINNSAFEDGYKLGCIAVAKSLIKSGELSKLSAVNMLNETFGFDKEYVLAQLVNYDTNGLSV